MSGKGAEYNDYESYSRSCYEFRYKGTINGTGKLKITKPAAIKVFGDISEYHNGHARTLIGLEDEEEKHFFRVKGKPQEVKEKIKAGKKPNS